MASDTIFALTTAGGLAAVAVVRISGPAAADVCRRLTQREPPPARRATLRRLSRPASDEPLDQALLIWFPGPASLTGEDVLELQLHGGRAVVGNILEALADFPGTRPAEPGEFARRGFLNGRFDLTAAEGLADLVMAETRAQAVQALRQLDGDLGRLYDGWRSRILAALATIEAEIDFAPEEDVPAGLVARVLPEVGRLSAEIGEHLDDRGRGERLRSGLTVAVVGPPNAGKSSLVNLLARRDVAIVNELPGTTRDVLTVDLELGGFPVTLADTAGLRAPLDAIEAEGVRRARRRAETADLCLVLLDGADWPAVDRDVLTHVDADAIVAVNKSDLGRVPAAPRVAGRGAIAMSCITGEGIEPLLQALTGRAADLMTSGAEPALTRARHRAALQAAGAALERLRSIAAAPELALVAEELRVAATAIGRITGRIGVEDLLDRIFADFCIGK